MLRTSRNTPTKYGGYTMLAYEGCTDLYRGPGEADSAYLVARNTEQERMFKRSQLAEATQYAIETRQQIENLPLTALCAQAVEVLLAS